MMSGNICRIFFPGRESSDCLHRSNNRVLGAVAAGSRGLKAPSSLSCSVFSAFVADFFLPCLQLNSVGSKTPQGDEDGICALAAGVKAQDSLPDAGGGRKRERALVRRPVGEGTYLHTYLPYRAVFFSVATAANTRCRPVSDEWSCERSSRRCLPSPGE